MQTCRKIIALIVLFILVIGVAEGLLLLRNYYQVESVALVGQPLPYVVLTDVNGKPVSLDEYRGKKLLIAFVDIKCGFCQEQFKVLEEICQKVDNDELSIVAVIRNDPIMPVDLTQKSYHSFPILTDSQRQLRKKLGVTRVPTLFLLDQYGVLRYTEIGYQTLDEVEKYISGMDKPS